MITDIKESLVLAELTEHQHIIEKVIKEITADIDKGCELMLATILAGHKVYLAGNGGSAADAQHIAAELTGRFVKERKPLPGVALTTDTSAITAIANDYGYDQVFARQLEALAQPGDLFIGISTSGNSDSILNAINIAKKLGCKTLGLTGKGGGQITDLCDVSIIVPSGNTARIQEIHILIGHVFCKAVDNLF